MKTRKKKKKDETQERRGVEKMKTKSAVILLVKNGIGDDGA